MLAQLSLDSTMFTEPVKVMLLFVANPADVSSLTDAMKGPSVVGVDRRLREDGAALDTKTDTWKLENPEATVSMST
jgi:hypothetical protein